MNRLAAKRIHELTNITYWAEMPGFDMGSPGLNFLCQCLRSLPFSTHDLLKRSLFDSRQVLAVNGETVVADRGDGRVDKFMFRYPKGIDLTKFFTGVEHEVGTLTSYLAGVALETQVGIKPARIFRLPGVKVDAVTQTQLMLDLSVHTPIDMDELDEERSSSKMDKTVRDLEKLVHGTHSLASEFEYYPDIAPDSNNLRRSQQDGSVTLIDVMPIYTDGSRLIGDGADIITGTLKSLRRFEDIVGQYGA